MIYDVKGEIKIRHSCDCVFCSVKEEDDIVDARVIADNEQEAARKALTDWRGIRWVEEPEITRIMVPFNKHPDIILRTFDDFVTDGFIAVRKELIDLDGKEVKPTKTPKWAENKHCQHLEYQGMYEPNYPTYLLNDGTEIYIQEIYHEAVMGLGLNIYTISEVYQNGEPLALVDTHRGKIMGYVAPMDKPR